MEEYALYIYIYLYGYICTFMCKNFEKQIADLIAYCTLCTVVIRCSVVCIETVALFFLFFESLFRQENQSARGAAGKEKQSLGKTCDECILVSTNNLVSCLLVFSSLKGFTFPTSNMASEKWRKGIWVSAFYIRSWVGPCLFIRRYKLKQNLIAGVHRERYWTASPYQSYYQLFVCQQIEPLSGVTLLTQHIGFSPSSWMCFPVVNTKVKSFCDPNGKDLEDYRRHQRMVQVRQDVTCSVVYVMLHIDGSYMPIESCTYKRWGCMIVKWFSWVKSCHSCHCSQMTPAPTCCLFCWYDIVQPGWRYKLPSSLGCTAGSPQQNPTCGPWP